MDYNLYQKAEPTEISESIDIGLPYGDMGNEPMIAKFEETQSLNDGEDQYDYYARDTLKDTAPDRPAMESGEARTSLGGSGFLNLRHYGSRSGAEDAVHREIYLEESEPDPRGTSTEPDFKKFTEQTNARMKFVRFSSDADNSITGGGWSEAAANYAARQTTQRLMTPRMKIFSTSQDGRRNGLNREFKHRNAMDHVAQGGPETYGDRVRDWAMNPQRKTTMLSNTLLRTSRLYSQNTPDHEFAVARYGESARRRKLAGANKSIVIDRTTTAFAHQDDTAIYKAAGVLMGNIVKAKHSVDHDVDYGEEQHTQARKTEKLHRDLTVILRAIDTTGEFGTHDNTMQFKQAKLQRAAHLARVQTRDEEPSAHHLVSAELMYKSVKPGADVEKIRRSAMSDARRAALVEESIGGGKSARKDVKTGIRDSLMEVDGKSLDTVSYKTLQTKANGPGRKNQSGEMIAKYSRDTQMRKVARGKHRITQTTDVDPDTDKQFNDNASKERHGAPIGTKYMTRYIDTDSSRDVMGE